MKKLVLFFAITIYSLSIEAQHMIVLTNNTLEDITLRLNFLEDDPSCGGGFSSTVIFVPCCASGPSLTLLGAPTGPVTTGTPVLFGPFDNILMSVEILTSGGFPVIGSSLHTTPNITWNTVVLTCFPPLGPPFTFTSAISGVVPYAWTSLPNGGTTLNGNLSHTDEINF